MQHHKTGVNNLPSLCWCATIIRRTSNGNNPNDDEKDNNTKNDINQFASAFHGDAKWSNEKS